MPTIEQFDHDLARLQSAIAAIESAPRSFGEVWPGVEAALDHAEQIFRRFGPQLDGRTPTPLPEYAEQRRAGMLGACLVAGRGAIVAAERERVERLTQGGMAAPDKARRLAQLRGEMAKVAARRELQLRSIEGDGFMPRPIHPEFCILPKVAVERIAAG